MNLTVCIPGQRLLPRVATVAGMKLEDIGIAVVLAWAFICGVIAVALVSSASSWVLVVASGVLPPLVILRMWHPPSQAVPAIIGDVRK